MTKKNVEFMNILVCLCLLWSSTLSFACTINWEKLPYKTPLKVENVRPQGLTFFNDYLVLTNHFKDTAIQKPSEIIFIDKKHFQVQKKLSFPSGYFHVAGLATDHQFIYASDFDSKSLLRINVEASLSKNTLVFQKLFDLPTSGASGLSIHKNLLAVSFYIVPYRSPYFEERRVHFYELKTGKRVLFEGNVLGSNYSQGLAFFEINRKLFLAEAINLFSSVIKYWITGLDDSSDIIRIYSVDIARRKISHTKDLSFPGKMIEDLTFDKERYLYTTDEQDFHFYRGMIVDDCTSIGDAH